jgi:hypothetical protein
MGLGDISQVSLESHAEAYQPSGTSIFRCAYIFTGLQTNQCIRMMSESDASIEADLWKKDGGVNITSGFPAGMDSGSNVSAAMNGLYISNEHFVQLNGASSAGNQMVLTLIEVVA